MAAARLAGEADPPAPAWGTPATLVVVGAHLSGQPLNHELTDRGGRLIRPATTAAAYRLHALATDPPKPGLVRVSSGGAPIAAELWALPVDGFGDFVRRVPSPLSIGTVELEDGSRHPGFLCEGWALAGTADITALGGLDRLSTSTGGAAGMTTALQLARDLARTPSLSGDEEAAVRLVVAAMEEAGFDEVRIDGSGNAIGVITGGPGRRLLIDGHIDSIPLHSAEQWTVDPFGGEIVDGRLYGLGICDQKASIAAAVAGVAAARRSITGSVAVVASVCEEAMEGQALAEAVSWFNPDTVVTSEPNDTRLGIGQRGRAKLEVTVKGRSCHAGHAGEGLNAASALAALIVEADRIKHPIHPDLGVRHLTCIDLASWPFPSVSTVPGVAQARFDCRFLPGETAESLTALLAGCARTGVGGVE